MNNIDQVWLEPLGRFTTRAGYGCASLMGALSLRESHALLSAAWDAGVRHFDVAPLYGHGAAERALGSFLKGRRHEVTLATKFGLEPTESSRMFEVARTALRPLVRRVSGIRKYASRRSTISLAEPQFKPADLGRAIERSLLALQTDYLDILLLHEATVKALEDEQLLLSLENATRRGLIRSFGVGGSSRNVPALYRNRISYSPIFQFDWCLLDWPVPRVPGCPVIVFGALSPLKHPPALQRLEKLLDSPRFIAKSGWAPLLLRTTSLATQSSVILFSSRDPAHVDASAKAISDTSIDDVCWKLIGKLNDVGIEAGSGANELSTI